MVPINFALLRHVAGIRFAELWIHVWRIVVGTLLMGATVWYLFRGSEITGSATALRLLLEQVAIGVFTYTVVVYATWIAAGRPPGPEHLAEKVARRVLGRWTRRYAD
jgi:hypothetical protein